MTKVKGKLNVIVWAGVVAMGCMFLLVACAHLLQNATENSSGLKIAPYFIYTPDHHILMKFAMASDQTQARPLLTVNGRVKDYQNQKDSITGLMEVDIGAVACDQKMEVALTDAKNETEQNATLKFQIPPFACSADKKISFLFIADTHGNASFYAREMPLILERHSDKNVIAIIHGGDWISEGTDLADWNKMAQAVGDAGGARPILSAIGNHEYHGYTSWDKQQAQKSLPEHRELQHPEQRNSNIPVIFKKYFLSSENDQLRGYHRLGYYSIHYPQAVLIFINSNKLGESDRGEQWSFIKREMVVAESEKKPIIIVSHHSLLGSNIFRINKIEGRRLREKLIPILEEQEQKIELAVNESDRNLPMIAVLSAHSHLNEVSEKNGIYYLNAGAFGGWPMFGLWGNPYQITSSSLTSTYSIVTVSQQGISIETYKLIAGNWQ